MLGDWGCSVWTAARGAASPLHLLLPAAWSCLGPAIFISVYTYTTKGPSGTEWLLAQAVPPQHGRRHELPRHSRRGVLGTYCYCVLQSEEGHFATLGHIAGGLSEMQGTGPSQCRPPPIWASLTRQEATWSGPYQRRQLSWPISGPGSSPTSRYAATQGFRPLACVNDFCIVE